MTKSALENAQELLKSLEGDYKQKGEVAIGWAIIEIASQIGRVATQLGTLNKNLSERK